MEKVKKVRINSDQENLIRLLEHHSPSDRQDFLNYIDKINSLYNVMRQFFYHPESVASH